MRIVVVTPSYPPYRGGMGNVAFHFTKHLAALGHDLKVFTPRYKHMKKMSNDDNVVLLRPWAAYGNAAFVPQLFWKLSGYDVVYAHLPFIGAEKGLLWFKLWHPKTKLVVHYQMDLIGGGFLRVIFWIYSQIFLRLLLAVADTIIVSSKDYIENSHIKSSFNNNRVVVLANGINYSDFANNNVSQPKQQKPYILFVGGLDKAHHFKGVSLLIRAWQKVHKLFPDANLVIVGNGSELARYEKEARLSKAASSIHFKSNVDNELLVGYYKYAKATVLPSTTRGEAFGIVLLESMAAGTPVVASGLPGVRTLIQENRNGWTFTPRSEKDLIKALKKSLDADNKSMRDYTQSFAKEFDWNKLTLDLEKILQK